MKSAEEWINECPEVQIDVGNDVITPLDPTPEWVQKIQLNAWKQGMSDAADISGEYKYAYDAESEIRAAEARRLSL